MHIQNKQNNKATFLIIKAVMELANTTQTEQQQKTLHSVGARLSRWAAGGTWRLQSSGTGGVIHKDAALTVNSKSDGKVTFKSSWTRHIYTTAQNK